MKTNVRKRPFGAGQSVSARDMHCGCAKLSMSNPAPPLDGVPRPRPCTAHRANWIGDSLTSSALLRAWLSCTSQLQKYNDFLNKQKISWRIVPKGNKKGMP